MPASSDHLGPIRRGPDQAQRERATFRDANEGTAATPDWARFGIQISLNNLRPVVPFVIKKIITKLLGVYQKKNLTNSCLL